MLRMLQEGYICKIDLCEVSPSLKRETLNYCAENVVDNTYDRHEREDVVEEVVSMISHHFSISHNKDLDETFLRDGTADSMPSIPRTSLPVILYNMKKRKVDIIGNLRVKT